VREKYTVGQRMAQRKRANDREREKMTQINRPIETVKERGLQRRGRE
jgi:hypothetical protein